MRRCEYCGGQVFRSWKDDPSCLQCGRVPGEKENRPQPPELTGPTGGRPPGPGVRWGAIVKGEVA
jgi:hypothetical protein